MARWMNRPISYIDISVSLQQNIPRWPGTAGFRLEWLKRLDAGDRCNNSQIECDTHTGTHVDAPLHFIRKGKTIEQLALDILIGPVWVAYLPDATDITSFDLSKLDLPYGTKRLLLRTRNSELWAAHENNFQTDFVALTLDAANWLIEKGIQLIGIDYLSVQRYKDGPEVHQILLGADVVIVEGLNLANVKTGIYELICLPIKISGAEGAPARAVLRSFEMERPDDDAVSSGFTSNELSIRSKP
ncbi:cyclase family protein [Thermodesulfobacteriota bacterium]